VEVPLFVDRLPEGWNFPSFMTIVIQAANVGLIFWSILRCICKPSETVVIYILLIVAATGTALTGVLWDVTTTIGGTRHSVPLLVLTAVIALVDCLSNVVFLPFVASFTNANYVTAYYIGGWMGSVLPGVLGLIQGVGKDPECVNSTHNRSAYTYQRLVPVYPDPLFSVNAFCFILSGLVMVSIASYTVLLCGTRCRYERSNWRSSEFCAVNDETRQNVATRRATGSDARFFLDDNAPTSSDGVTASSHRISSKFVKLLLLIFIVNCLSNGFLPSLQSYACLPYGRLVYTLAVRLSAVSGPLACIVALRWSTSSVFKLALIAVFGIILSAYQIGMASMSPHPVLEDSVVGKALMVSVSTIRTTVYLFL
jgi:riboflavin transporter 2